MPDDTPTSLTESEEKILRHSLCGGATKPYRNYYAASICVFPQMETLVAKGFMRKGNLLPYGAYYHATRAGAAAIGLSLPTDAGWNCPADLGGKL